MSKWRRNGKRVSARSQLAASLMSEIDQPPQRAGPRRVEAGDDGGGDDEVAVVEVVIVELGSRSRTRTGPGSASSRSRCSRAALGPRPSNQSSSSFSSAWSRYCARRWRRSGRRSEGRWRRGARLADPVGSRSGVAEPGRETGPPASGPASRKIRDRRVSLWRDVGQHGQDAVEAHLRREARALDELHLAAGRRVGSG